MEHIMKLYESSFEELKTGKKKREYRLNDEKRRLVRIGDTIRFLKLPNLDEEFVVDVKGIETFDNWYDCYSKYYDEDFKDRYESVDSVVQDTYDGGYYTKEESEQNGCVIFSIKKHRVAHLNSTACYLKKDNKVLMIKFAKKWGNVYAPPGGKFEEGKLEWIKIEDLLKLTQFDQNEKFTPYLFKDKLFEGKFLLDEKCKALKYQIREM